MSDSHQNNHLIHRDRRLAKSESEWVRSFSCEDMGVLIVCRGPIRKEALDVFAEMGIEHVGILLSEKDSIVYPRALAPELRNLDPSRVHAVPDYSGATKDERVARIKQIIRIAKKNNYGYVFAGYGFMAEDEEFVRSIEEAGLGFIGPCSHTVNAAGLKDEAKRTALKENVSVTPGINNVTARILLKKCGDLKALRELAQEHSLDVDALTDDQISLEDGVDALLDASYQKGVDLYSIDELCAQVEEDARAMLDEYSGNRVRLKAIGGGGGKGQRILSDASEAPALVREILSEVKALGIGDNKNVLIELNIETTRHNEIQLVGNGEWCISLGGRDCSLQMHEQKLLEVSMTQDALAEAVTREKEAGNQNIAEAIAQDLAILRKMEEEAERFGRAVKLDSASTFECIVDGPRHYFMEVNTRIQVEHRVSELCYALRFRSPQNSENYFDVHSLVEMMALLARHKERLPKPERIRRDAAAVEARLNATDSSLSPHAGGEIIYWSNPIEGEVRDDQGICYKNPDTGLFVRYKLAGAYDSNIALLVTTGVDRRASYEKLWEVLRATELRGPDLQTNLNFHYGLVSWFLANGVDAKPTTRFVVPYLTLVGLLKEQANEVDLEHAFKLVSQQHLAQAGEDAEVARAIQQTLTLKQTLVLRPLARLLEDPHLLSAWLSTYKECFEFKRGAGVKWLCNPLKLLADTYHLLHMDDERTAPAAHRIWDHDQEILEEGAAFYDALVDEAKAMPWRDLNAALGRHRAMFGYSKELWNEIRAAHRGFQIGLEVLGILPAIAHTAGFYDLKLNEDQTVHIPESLFDAELQARMKKVLVPPPATKADEIVAVSGGMYYGQEAPGMPSFVQEGQHFEQGDPLYIIEVMKMFNKVPAPFAGTVDKILIGDDGTIVAKGQPLFKITPDEKVTEEDPAVVASRRRKYTEAHLLI